MKITNLIPQELFLKGAFALIFAAFLFLSCKDDSYLDPVPVAAKEKQNNESLTANAHSSSHAKAAKNFVAPMDGGQEVPPVETKATGNAIFQLVGDDELHYKLIVANIENVLMAHIHLAPVGVNGGVVAWLYPSGPPPMLIPGKTNGILATGIITTEDLVGPLAGETLETLLEAMRSGGTYVNVHTEQFPGGEIRGQIKPAGPK